jgi:hypothetical protein
MLMEVLNARCQAHGIARECPERLEIARRLAMSFENGARTPEMLRAALTLTDAPNGNRLHPRAARHMYKSGRQ